MKIPEKPKAVRVSYIVPDDAESWTDLRRRATEVLEAIRQFFLLEMTRSIYGPKTFDILYADDGLVDFREIATTLPKVLFEEGRDKGIPLCRKIAGPSDQTYVEACFIESNPVKDGRVCGDIAGASERRAYLSSLYLKVASREWLSNEDAFSGKLPATISPTPILKWPHRGKTFGDIAGGGFGVICHELAHCFGTQNHNSEFDDEQCSQDMMGTGYRRMKRYLITGNSVGCCAFGKRALAVLSNSLHDVQ